MLLLFIRWMFDHYEDADIDPEVFPQLAALARESMANEDEETAKALKKYLELYRKEFDDEQSTDGAE